ncbi:hypothetical protein OSSY52_15680 [Tepiditoga spiralis]|uniref:Ferrous iron transporter FeoA-like domain-containing protein n=1 Tax=Tepiditoga spiralis TaxID=2108365 RepID=A0A7G1G8X8_9BACT|nr:ferrous iron transport protein A [Tepiditoga spiralis]BBE31427.1 hypothetical protein OSSY52_15680 [Tepiditoga spiralis]
MILSKCKPGTVGTVVKLNGTMHLNQRLTSMGITSGIKIEVKKTAPLGDPVELKVRGYNLSLRKSEANIIEIDIGDGF